MSLFILDLCHYTQGKLAQVRLEEDDSIVLQVQEDSPLLTPAPEDLFDDLGDGGENGGEDGGSSPATTRMRWKGMLRKGSKLSASMSDIVSMAMGSNMNDNNDEGDGDVNNGDSTMMTTGADSGGSGASGGGGGGVSLKGVSIRSRATGGPKGILRESTSFGEIRVEIPEDDGTNRPGGEPSNRGGGGGGGGGDGEASAMGAATDGGVGGDGDGTVSASSTGGEQPRENKNSGVDLGGISIRSERPEAPDPESIEKARRVRMAHRDLEVTGAGSDEAGKEFLIAVRIKSGARNFIKKTADEAGLRALPGLFLVSIERWGRSLTSFARVASVFIAVLTLVCLHVFIAPRHCCTQPRSYARISR